MLIFEDPKFWTFIAFIIFILAMIKPTKNMVLTNLDSRIDTIRKSIEESEKLKEEAHQLLINIKKNKKNLEKDIENIQFEAKEKITSIKNEITEKFEKQVTRRKIIAEQQIKSLEIEAISEIKKQIIDDSINQALEIIKTNLSPQLKERFIKKSIKELNLSLRN